MARGLATPPVDDDTASARRDGADENGGRAGVALLSAARLRGQSLAVPRRHWPTIMAATFFDLVCWNIASTYAAILIPPGQAAILGFTMPLWMALISWVFLGKRRTGRLGAAIGLGAVAVALLMWRGAEAYARAPLGFFLGLPAGLGWAMCTLILKRQPVPVSALVLTAGAGGRAVLDHGASRRDGFRRHRAWRAARSAARGGDGMLRGRAVVGTG